MSSSPDPQPTPPAASFPPVPTRMLDEYDLRMRPRRRILPLILFLATCFFTFAAGAYHWQPTFFGMSGDDWNPQFALEQIRTHWLDGLIYMGCVMGILVAHEMGHFLMTVRYRVPASFPFFLPIPFMFTGTMGAVISMEGFRANRKQVFDIGLAGPIAGLVLAIPMLWIGIKIAHPWAEPPSDAIRGNALIARLLINWLRPDLNPSALQSNPLFMAGWVGMIVTGLNMMPVSQLDGGHLIYALFLKRGHWIARAFLISAIAFVVIKGQYSWITMLILITLIGVDHPPTADDSVPLGPARTILGFLCLTLPVLCFTPLHVIGG